MFETLRSKILSRKAKIGIIGLGYVGLPLAIAFAKKGFKVWGIDIDKDRVSRLKKGQSYILDLKPSDIVTLQKDGAIIFTSDLGTIKKLDAFIICVPTPLLKTKEPDVSFIVSATELIKKHMKPGQVVVLESTTYPGTTEEVVLPILESTGLKECRDFYLAFSPERIDPGNAKYFVTNIPKVVGGISQCSTEIAKILYEQIIDKVMPVSSCRAAEMTKLLENTFRIVNLGLINELTLMCDKLSMNIWEIIDAAKTKPYGFMPFYPGPGVGGHCLTKDEYVYVKDVGEPGLRPIKICDFIRESKEDSRSRIHNINGSIFIRPASKEVLSYDPIKKKSCFKEVRMLSERPYEGKVVNIKTQGNRTMSVTNKHPMIVSKDGVLGVKFADEIELNDKIPIFPDVLKKSSVDHNNLKMITSKVGNIAYSKTSKVYSMEVQDTNTFVTSYGMLTHNCIPIDPLYLSWKARAHGFETRFINLASEVNEQMPRYVVEKIADGLNNAKKALKGAKILLSGVAYKKDVQDLRESPVFEIIEILNKHGSKISYYDPYFPYFKVDGIDLKCVKFDKKTLRSFDCVVVVTDHSNVDYRFMAKNSKLIIDTRNALKDVKNRTNIVRI